MNNESKRINGRTTEGFNKATPKQNRHRFKRIPKAELRETKKEKR